VRFLIDNDDDSCGSAASSEDKAEGLGGDDIDQLVNSTNILVDRLSINGCPAVPCAFSGQGDTTTLLHDNCTGNITDQDKPSTRQTPPPTEQQENLHQVPCSAAAASPKDPEAKASETESLVILRCFAPEGTPIQGREYPVGQHGATLGRKQGNSISFSHKVCDVSNGSPGGRYSFVGIDSSISGEHATVAYNNDKGVLELFDGVGDRCSTNGTWVRLSPMHKQSEWYPLEDKTEILIGTVRFQVSIDEVVVERDIYE